MTREERAVEAVKKVTPDGSRFKVTGTIDNVMDGTLVFVEFKHDIDVWNEKYALFKGETVTVIANSQELVTAFTHWSSQPQLVRLLRLLSEPPVMAAVIALITISAAGWYAVNSQTGDLPTWLGAALAGVLAFYVGTKTA